MDLSTELIQDYWTHGFAVFPDLVPRAICDRIIEVALEQESARDKTFSPIPMPHKKHPLFLSMMCYSPIVKIVEKLVAGEASGVGGEFFYMRPGTPGFAIHQDNAYVQAPPDMFCSAWTALCDIDRRNGALYFFPGSHKLGPLPTREREDAPDPGQNPGARACECMLPPGRESIDMTLKKGDVVLFHSLAVHGSHSNESNRFRYSFLATYIRKNQPYRPGRSQKRTEVDLYADAGRFDI